MLLTECPICHCKLQEESRFCVHCGKELINSNEQGVLREFFSRVEPSKKVYRSETPFGNPKIKIRWIQD